MKRSSGVIWLTPVTHPANHTYSKWDFGFLGGILFAGVWILIIWGVINAIWGFDEGRVYALIGSIIFSLYVSPN